MPDYSIETDPLRLVVQEGNTEWEITAPDGVLVVREYYPGDRMIEHRTTDIPLPRAALVEFARAVLAGELLNRDKDSPCYWPDCVCHTNLLCLNQGRKLRQALGHTGADD